MKEHRQPTRRERTAIMSGRLVMRGCEVSEFFNTREGAA